METSPLTSEEREKGPHRESLVHFIILHNLALRLEASVLSFRGSFPHFGNHCLMQTSALASPEAEGKGSATWAASPSRSESIRPTPLSLQSHLGLCTHSPVEAGQRPHPWRLSVLVLSLSDTCPASQWTHGPWIFLAHVSYIGSAETTLASGLNLLHKATGAYMSMKISLPSPLF